MGVAVPLGVAFESFQPFQSFIAQVYYVIITHRLADREKEKNKVIIPQYSRE